MKLSPLMKKERYAAILILLAFFSGMFLTAATSGCDASNSDVATQSEDAATEDAGTENTESTEADSTDS